MVVVDADVSVAVAVADEDHSGHGHVHDHGYDHDLLRLSRDYGTNCLLDCDDGFSGIVADTASARDQPSSIEAAFDIDDQLLNHLLARRPPRS
jgi:hypothetical protein